MDWKYQMRQAPRAGVLLGILFVPALGHADTVKTVTTTAEHVEQLLVYATTTAKREQFAIAKLVATDPAAAQRRALKLQAQMNQVLADAQQASANYQLAVQAAAVASASGGVSGGSGSASGSALEGGAGTTTADVTSRERVRLQQCERQLLQVNAQLRQALGR